jgi:hypothetical protein
MHRQDSNPCLMLKRPHYLLTMPGFVGFLLFFYYNTFNIFPINFFLSLLFYTSLYSKTRMFYK